MIFFRFQSLALLAGGFLLSSVNAEVTPRAHYHLKMDEGAIRDTAAPEILTSFADGGPALKSKGSPKVMSSGPKVRSRDYTGSIKFEVADQCYATNRHLAKGDNWMVEVWVNAAKALDPGLHTVLANGDGGLGFLIAQDGNKWILFIGGMGAHSLGEVTAETWTHLAVVRDRGKTSAWIDGRKVADGLPTAGGGAANFSLGASSPGKEPFNGWIAEARVSTFESGAFDPASDFLIDVAKAKLIHAAGKKKVAAFIRSLGRTEGIKTVTSFDSMAYEGDWLIKAPKTDSSVQIMSRDEMQSASIMLTNGLVSREFLVTDGNIGCTSFRRADENIEFVRAIKAEARICLNGRWWDIGGLTGAPDQAFITPAWYPLLSSIPNSFQLAGMKVGPCVKPYHWEPKCNAPADIAWPANGRRVTFHFEPPSGNDSLRGVSVDLHYEIYDGLPVMMKTFTLHNDSGKEIVVTKFEGEHLAVQPGNSALMHVESDYSCALFNFTETSSGLGIHANGGRAKFKDYYQGGGTTRFLRDPNWGSMATLNPAEDIFLGDIENALLVSRPPTGPNWTVESGGSFEAFRTYEILNDSSERERRFLAQRRFYNVLAPQTNEKMFEVHAPSTRDPAILEPLLDQMNEIGFEILQAPEHPGSFNYADSSPENIQSMKAICDYARKYDIRVGAYQLMMASQGGWGAESNCIDPVTLKPGSAFGQSACGASAWADMYFDNMWKTIEGAGMGAFKPDGPYHGDSCASTDHAHHKGLEDSQWAQWKWMCKVLAEGQRRNLYLTIPDWYFLNGQTCTGMGYREATDNIDVGLQTVILRQYIFDATWHKTAGMGWINLNTEVLPGGMEKNLEKYERHFFSLLSSGAQVWVRGHRLYDGPKSKAMLLKWMSWYRKYREIIQGDIIHLRRPDGRDIDYYLHVNPKGREKGMLLVFNPLQEEVTREIELPLYYTGLSGTVAIRDGEGTSKDYRLDGGGMTKMQVTIPADGFRWFVIE